MTRSVYVLGLAAVGGGILVHLLLTVWNPWARLDYNVPAAEEAREPVGLIVATNDVFHAALLLSQKFFPDSGQDIGAADRSLADMVSRVRARVHPGDPPVRVVGAMNEYFFHERRFSASDNDADESILLPGPVLRNRRGHCVSLTLLYLAAGEKLKIPLHARYVPGHVWVALDRAAGALNIETTAQGAILPDSYYQGLVFPAAERRRYPRQLTKRQLLGLFLHDVGFCLDQQGKTKPALAAYLEAKELFPEDPLVHVNLGSLYQFMGKYREARDVLEQALRLHPFIWQIHSNLGPLWYDLEDYPKSISAYKRTIRLLHKMLTIDDYVVYPGRIEDLREKVRSHPGDPRAINILGVLLFREGKYAESAAVFDRLLALDPRNARTCAKLAIVHYHLGRFDQVRRYGRMERQMSGYGSTVDVSNLVGTMVSSYVGLGNAYEKDGDRDQALRILTRAVEIDSTNTDALAALADLYVRRGEPRKAIALYRRIAKMDSSRSDIRKKLERLSKRENRGDTER
jgi:tetratricopeptide (TPR) repeat protein